MRLSPGAKAKSTANMAGWTSNVGSSVEGSTSSSSARSIPKPRPTCPAVFADSAAGDDALGDKKDDIIDDELDFRAGVQGNAGDPFDDEGDKSENILDESDEARECVLRIRGFANPAILVQDDEDDMSNEDLMSMLPPPMACLCFRSSATRTELRAPSCWPRVSELLLSPSVKEPTS